MLKITLDPVCGSLVTGYKQEMVVQSTTFQVQKNDFKTYILDATSVSPMSFGETTVRRYDSWPMHNKNDSFQNYVLKSNLS